ncbi:DUF1223 domain-containing protein [Mucilaginibacter panaciglaebae]|uniref:DUF1223 domain-containing protein n=1 Tax=Mucilaginibacter panaciglaebae TaxID=502331 RepID=A0ABP7WYX1_9SPHI
MKYIKIITLPGLCLIGSFLSAFCNQPNPAKSGFAVIELFTSEGCSSCPPADELVAKVQKEYQNEPVYILSFHVDYWNRLGWKDVYSNADYSKRQEAYAKSLHIPSVYTPQIVVNGSKEFVGSQDGVLRNAIKAALHNTGSAQISLSNIINSGTKITIHYHTVGTSKYSEVILALVQKSAQTNVKAGENKGHILSHVQIVRQMQRFAVGNKDGTTQLMLPKGVSSQNIEVIALVQDNACGQITGATKQPLPIAS